MQFSAHIIEKLKQELTLPLPDEATRYRMAPSYRPKLTAEQIAANKPRISAVLILLYERNGLLQTVFIKRKAYDGVHSAQISFPGGKRDETDADLIATALREANEELGIDGNTVEILGSLSELYIPPSNFLVYPALGYTKIAPDFILNEYEVDAVIEIPLSFFLDSVNVNLQTEISLHNGTRVKVPAFIFQSHIIWGATAIILSEFAYLLEQATKPTT